ncbi:hypothetical protein BL253_32075 [Pseudofrankia asymbiotica]|uniref:Uncharacterized protein n=1 Tax=Pseudofrankia asymbiotica TaxID=1834516 RepID=A0A1V2I3U3_9ACTN|nr:hypothetical protein BL253_32075 [Pseudofrankia asymbiotica]
MALTTVLAVVFATLVALVTTRGAHAAPPPEFERTLVADGLNEPTSFRFLPDGRIFVAEKAGAIKVIQNGQVGTTPVITLITRKHSGALLMLLWVAGFGARR